MNKKGKEKRRRERKDESAKAGVPEGKEETAGRKKGRSWKKVLT